MRFATVMMLLTILCLFTLEAEVAYANPTPDCTSDPQMQANNAPSQAIVTSVMQTIIALLNQTSQNLYESVLQDPEFIAARNAVLLLAIAIYGAMIVFNMVNMKPGEILAIIFKVGLIVGMTTSWEFFDRFIGQFFFGTMLEMIEIFMTQGTSGMTVNYTGPGSLQGDVSRKLGEPLRILNWPTAQIFSTQYFITILAVVSHLPYGPILALLLIWGGFNLIMALIGALFTYIKSIVGMWFLFALAPIFFMFLLFRRTMNIFQGWLNMVLSFALQPILLFAFLSFFMTIVSASMNKMLRVEWCWIEVQEATEGSRSGISWWRAMKIGDTKVDGATWTLMGAVGKDQDGNPLSFPFPIDTIDLMFFLLSTYIAFQYSRFVPRLATELSQINVRMSVSAESARTFFSARGLTPEQAGGRLLSGFAMRR